MGPKLILEIIVLLLVIGIFIAMFNLSSIYAMESRAYKSGDALASAMNLACQQGSSTVSINIQQANLLKSLSSGVIGIFASGSVHTTYVNMFADPDFLLYYESYPIGEDLVWTIYTDLPARSYIGFNQGDNLVDFNHTSSEVENQIKDLLEQETEEKNIYVKAINTLIPEKYGEWDKNFFRFNNYMGLPLDEKSDLKYYTCGENSLCLKTHKGIYAYPLDECNIDFVQMNVNEDLLGKTVDDQERVFGLFGPCKARLEIKTGVGDECTCNQKAEYSLYNVSNNKATKIGENTYCYNAIDRSNDNDEVKCLIVDVEDQEGFCYIRAGAWDDEGSINLLNMFSGETSIKEYFKNIGKLFIGKNEGIVNAYGQTIEGYPLLRNPGEYRSAIGMENLNQWWRWPE